MNDTYSFDFHVHSHLSDADANQSPDAVCAAAVQAGLNALSITDHDHLLCETRRRELARQYALELVPGCEVSCVWAPKGTSRRAIVHLGGHWLNSSDPTLRQIVAHNSAQPFDRYVLQMLRNVRSLGLDPGQGRSDDYVYERICAAHPHSVHHGKRDVALYLAANNVIPDRQFAYELLARGGMAYVDPLSVLDFLPFEEAVPAIARHGLCTLNHLYYSHLDDLSNHALLRDFKRLGGAALEVLYPRYGANRQAELRRFCREYGLLANCGSDRHDASRPFLPGPARMYRLLRQRQLELHGTLNMEESV